MTSIFQHSRQTIDEQPEDVSPVFQFLKEHKENNIIPPIGLAKPELVQSFMENMEDEEKIKRDIADVEAYERETPTETGIREILGHGARGLEGFLGGITSFLNMLTPDLELENEEGEIERHKPKKLPGANEFREITKKLTGNYLEPKTGFAKGSQEIASDIGSMFSTPGLGWLQKVLLPIGGQITKQAIKSSGGGESAQDLGKLGFMAISSIANLGNAQRVAGNAMQQARDMIPQGLRFSAQPTEQALQTLRNQPWFRSGRTPSKAAAMNEVDRIENMIQNGTIDAHDAMQLRVDLNEARSELGGFNWLTRPRDTRRALSYLDEVDRALLSSMENYGSRVNPNWWNQYNRANEAFRVTQRSRTMSDFISRHAKPLQSETAKILFHVGGAAAGTKLPFLAAAAAPVAATAKSIQVMNRMIQSPILRNHYLDVLRQAATGNAAATQKALEKFDLVSKKLEKGNKKEELKVQFHENEEFELNRNNRSMER